MYLTKVIYLNEMELKTLLIELVDSVAEYLEDEEEVINIIEDELNNILDNNGAEYFLMASSCMELLPEDIIEEYKNYILSLIRERRFA